MPLMHLSRPTISAGARITFLAQLSSCVCNALQRVPFMCVHIHKSSSYSAVTQSNAEGFLPQLAFLSNPHLLQMLLSSLEIGFDTGCTNDRRFLQASSTTLQLVGDLIYSTTHTERRAVRLSRNIDRFCLVSALGGSWSRRHTKDSRSRQT